MIAGLEEITDIARRPGSSLASSALPCRVQDGPSGLTVRVFPPQGEAEKHEPVPLGAPVVLSTAMAVSGIAWQPDRLPNPMADETIEAVQPTAIAFSLNHRTTS